MTNKKRRSSVLSHASLGTPAPRGSDNGGGHDDTVESQVETPVIDRAQEEAERRGRVRIQKRQSIGHAHGLAHAAVVNAAAAAAGTPASVQPDGTPLQPGSAVRGFSNAQLSEHYANCMKLSVENKINVKNAFHLQLIDYMTEMMRKKASDMDNFQAASCALDASAKIYAYRVDSVHSDTLKLAGGVGKTGPNDAPGGADSEMGEGVEGGLDPTQTQADKAVKRKKKAMATVEKNLNNINCSKFDLEFDVDPLFKKTSTQFDSGGGASSQFLYNLNIRDSTRSELLLDSNAVPGAEHINFLAPTQEDTPENRDLGEEGPLGLDEVDPRVANPALVIAPTFSNFTFRGWSVDDDEEMKEDEKKLDEEKKDNEHAFDAEAAPILDPSQDDYGGGGMHDEGGGPDDNFAGDSFFDGDDNVGGLEGDEVRVGNAAAGGSRDNVVSRERGVSLALIDNLREHLLAAPSEYSYFDTGKLGSWAGPQHWKFKPMRNVAAATLKNALAASGGADAQQQKGGKNKKKATLEEYEFDEMFAQCELTVLLDAVEKAMKIPKKAVGLQNKTMERWSDDKLLLPRDLIYKGKDFSKSFVTDFHITGRKPVSKKASQNLDDTVGDYNFDNPNDTRDFCPNVDAGEDDGDGGEGMDDDDGGDMFGGFNDGGFDDATVFPTQTQTQDPNADPNSQGFTMVQAPNRVEKIQIGYAKQAKKMDMRRLKTVEWKIMQDMGRNAGLNKENEDGNSQQSSDAETADKMEAPIRFTDLYKALYQPRPDIPSKMVDNMSVPLAFVALLHLCNEKSLALENVPDFSDFIIAQN